MKQMILEKFQIAAEDLGLRLVVPFELSAGGTQITAPILVQNFGDENGTVVILSEVAPSLRELETIAGTLRENGYSCTFTGGMSANKSPYVRASFIEMLRDWGWSGPADQRPPWL